MAPRGQIRSNPPVLIQIRHRRAVMTTCFGHGGAQGEPQVLADSITVLSAPAGLIETMQSRRMLLRRLPLLLRRHISWR